MDERPTRRVYIEILTCTVIIQHLEESTSHRNEREVDRARGQGARPPLVANHGESRGFCNTAFEDQGEAFNQCRFDPMAQIHLKRLYKQGPWPLERRRIPLFISIFSIEDSKREVP